MVAGIPVPEQVQTFKGSDPGWFFVEGRIHCHFLFSLNTDPAGYIRIRIFIIRVNPYCNTGTGVCHPVKPDVFIW